jgi:hypothetical protein
MACLELGFAVLAVSVVVASEPEVVNAYPHCPRELVEPEALSVGHFDVMAVAILLLKILPFFQEFTMEEVVPADG